MAVRSLVRITSRSVVYSGRPVARSAPGPIAYAMWETAPERGKTMSMPDLLRKREVEGARVGRWMRRSHRLSARNAPS